MTGAAIVVRVAVGRWEPADVVAALVTVALVGPVEWVMHRHLFHAPPASRRSRILGTGGDHARHHRDPDDLAWILLAPRAVRLLAGGLAVLVACWAVPLAVVLGAPPPTLFLTALTVALLALGHYEWTHLLVHAGYRPRSRYYRHLDRHHRLHHHRNERYWFGITSTWGDRLAGTLPADVAAVARSTTARSLDVDP